MITKAKLLKKALAPEDQQGAWGQYQEYSWDHDSEYPQKPDNLVIIFDFYNYEDYSGYGHLIGYDKIEKQFFEVHGSHCSCYGLEGQWEPEYTTIEEMIGYIQKHIDSLGQEDYYSYQEEERSRFSQLKELFELK